MKYFPMHIKNTIFLSCLISAGCAVKFENYTVPIISDPKTPITCPYNPDTKTFQAKELCRALMRVDQRRSELSNEITKSPSHFLDYSQLGLALLGASALAADSHISVLEGLGIATAGVVGFKSYSNDQARHSIYVLGVNGLTCIKAASSHLLWDDRWFVRLRYYRYALVNANSTAASLAETSNAELKKNFENLSKNIPKTLALADEATMSYSAIASVVDNSIINIINEAQKREAASRADVSEIAGKILTAEAIKTQKNEAVDKKSEELKQVAATNTPLAKAATDAVIATEKIISDDIDQNLSSTTLKDADPAKSISPLSGKDNNETMVKALAVAAKSIQEISYIAPRYIKAVNDTNSCTLK